MQLVFKVFRHSFYSYVSRALNTFNCALLHLFTAQNLHENVNKLLTTKYFSPHRQLTVCREVIKNCRAEKSLTVLNRFNSVSTIFCRQLSTKMMNCLSSTLWAKVYFNRLVFAVHSERFSTSIHLFWHLCFTCAF